MLRLPAVLISLSVLLFTAHACAERKAEPVPPSTTTGNVPNSTPTPTLPGGKVCPTPKGDVICTKEYRPVVCDGCTYANSCFAGAAGFKADQCISKAEADAKKACPEPAAGIVCTMEYAPVKCDGCTYPNACTAGAAGFTKEQCAPALGED